MKKGSLIFSIQILCSSSLFHGKMRIWFSLFVDFLAGKTNKLGAYNFFMYTLSVGDNIIKHDYIRMMNINRR
jgi:hypothetical protein